MKAGEATSTAAPAVRKIPLTKFWVDLALFLVALALAWALRWRAGDLVWSIWVSSLTIGYLTILAPLLMFATLMLLYKMNLTPGFLKNYPPPSAKLTVGDKAMSTPPWLGAIIMLGLGVFLLGFFTLHFGMFHFIHGSFLAGFFPLPELHYPKNPLGLVLFAGGLVKAYFPVVIVSAAQHIQNLRRNPSLDQFMTAPYKAVVRIHCLIFVFAGLHALHSHDFLYYVATLVAFCFPWQLLQSPKAA